VTDLIGQADMNKGTCGHDDGCDQLVRAKGLCRKHWREQYVATLKQQKCKNEQCDNPRGESGGYCPACYHRNREYGDPNAGPPRRKRRADSKKIGKRSTYYVNHAMVRKERGPAWSHQCEHCGERAQTWAMKHETSGESPDDYMALCWVCHAKYDNFASHLPDNTGSKRSAESRERMSQAQRLRYQDPAAREVMRQAALRRRAREREAREAESGADLVLF
jgi:hypothetical protein